MTNYYNLRDTARECNSFAVVKYDNHDQFEASLAEALREEYDGKLLTRTAIKRMDIVHVNGGRSFHMIVEVLDDDTEEVITFEVELTRTWMY